MIIIHRKTAAITATATTAAIVQKIKNSISNRVWQMDIYCTVYFCGVRDVYTSTYTNRKMKKKK